MAPHLPISRRLRPTAEIAEYACEARYADDGSEPGRRTTSLFGRLRVGSNSSPVEGEEGYKERPLVVAIEAPKDAALRGALESLGG